MTAAKFIATHNTPGVVAFAKRHGYDIPNDPRHAEDFLRQAWDSDPEAVKQAMYELHPHANFMGGQAHVSRSTMAQLKGYRNFDYSQFESAGDDLVSLMERGFDKGKEMASSLLNDKSSVAPSKDHTKEILTYGAVFLAGIFIGKFLMK